MNTPPPERKVMVRLRILEILEEQNHTKYWLLKQLDGMSYQNMNRMLLGETKGVRFDTIEKLSNVLGCSIGELFEKI